VTVNDVLSLSACFLTGNSRPPTDSGFQGRIIPLPSTNEDEHSEEEKRLQSIFYKDIVPHIGVLGDFTTNYVMLTLNHGL
jgi:hypothetical protein